jgi:polynucleotide 5'-kinase involved in rRNA processing
MNIHSFHHLRIHFTMKMDGFRFPIQSRPLLCVGYTIAKRIEMNHDESGKKKTKVILTGTPGIGKSLFLIYLLRKLVNENKRVLVIYHPFT